MPTQHNRMTKFCMVSKLFTGLRWSVVKVTDLHPAILGSSSAGTHESLVVEGRASGQNCSHAPVKVLPL